MTSFNGTEYRYGVTTGDISTHLLTDASETYAGYFGVSGAVSTGSLIFTAPSLQLVGGYICRQLTQSNRPTLRYSDGIYYIDPTSGQGLTAYLPESVGSTVTVIYANPGVGAVVITGVTVTSQAAWLPYKHSGLVIMPSTASTEAVAAVAAMVDVLARRTII